MGNSGFLTFCFVNKICFSTVDLLLFQCLEMYFTFHQTQQRTNVCSVHIFSEAAMFLNLCNIKENPTSEMTSASGGKRNS